MTNLSDETALDDKEPTYFMSVEEQKILVQALRASVKVIKKAKAELEGGE